MKELIERLRMMQSALGVDETCGEAAAALERMGAERDALKEQMTADRKQFLDMRDERDALRADAMRYRFIKDGNAYIEPNHYDEDGKVTKEMYMALETGKYYADMRDFDMDIDAAIGEKHDLPVA